MRYKSQENAVFIAIHPTTYRSGGFLAHGVLNAVVSQQLLPTVDGGIVPAFEIMRVTPAIRNMIRDGKIFQLDGAIFSSNGNGGMLSMDASIQKLYKQGIITRETALMFASNPDRLGI